MYSRPEEKRNFAFIITTVVSATTEVTAAGLVCPGWELGAVTGFNRMASGTKGGAGASAL